MKPPRMNVLVLAAGVINSMQEEKDYPSCLTEIDGKPLLELVVNTVCGLGEVSFTFALREEDIQNHHLDKIANLLAPGSNVVRVPSSARGAACSALLAASALPADEEVLVVSANELIDVDIESIIQDFRIRSLDAGTLIFHSVHPRYSYVRLDSKGYVIEASQKRPISHHATTGMFWFASAGDLVEAIKNMIRKDAHVDGLYYVAKTFNEMILKQKKIGVSHISLKDYHPLKTERQLFQFENMVQSNEIF